MPNQDQTGPQGQGPKTGRGLGKCNTQNSANQDLNRARNRRTGRCFQEKDAFCLRNKRASQ